MLIVFIKINFSSNYVYLYFKLKKLFLLKSLNLIEEKELKLYP